MWRGAREERGERREEKVGGGQITGAQEKELSKRRRSMEASAIKE